MMWERDGVVPYKGPTVARRWTTTDAEGRPLWAYTLPDSVWEPTQGYPSPECAWESFLYYASSRAQWGQG